MRCASCGRNLPADAFWMKKHPRGWQWRTQPCKRCRELDRRLRLGRRICDRKHLSPEERKQRHNEESRLRQARRRADPVLGPPLKADAIRRLREWKAAHPAERRLAKHLRGRTKKDMPAVSKTGLLTTPEWNSILAAFNGKCAYCDTGGEMQIEHIVAVAKGGTHTADNIVPACGKCNKAKNTHDLRTWLQDEDRYQFVCDMRSLA